jgi:hypothetical protein
VAEELREATLAERKHQQRDIFLRAQAAAEQDPDERDRLLAEAAGHRDLAAVIGNRRQALTDVEAAREQWYTETEAGRAAANEALEELQRRYPDADVGDLFEDPRRIERGVGGDEPRDVRDEQIEGQTELDLGDVDTAPEPAAGREVAAPPVEVAEPEDLREAVEAAKQAQHVLETRAREKAEAERPVDRALDRDADGQHVLEDPRRDAQRQVAEPVRQAPERSPDLGPQLSHVRQAAQDRDLGRSL